LPVAALTIAKMPARIGAGSAGHAPMIFAKSRSGALDGVENGDMGREGVCNRSDLPMDL
jgi:hypothetical protein